MTSTASQQDIKAITEIVTSTQNQLSDQLTEFKLAIDQRFEQIDQRFNKLEFRMDRFEGRLEQFENDTKAGFEPVNQTLDGIVGRITEDEVERAALSVQVARHEDWLVSNAPTLGVTYTPGA